MEKGWGEVDGDWGYLGVELTGLTDGVKVRVEEERNVLVTPYFLACILLWCREVINWILNVLYCRYLLNFLEASHQVGIWKYRSGA